MRLIFVAPIVGLVLIALGGCLPPVPEGIDGGSGSPPPIDGSAEVEGAPDVDVAADGDEWLEPAPSGAGSVDVAPIEAPRVRNIDVVREARAPEPQARDVSTNSAAGYVVPRGKTLYAISREQGVSVKDLIAANNLVEPYHLSAGQRIAIPKGGTAMARVATPAAKEPAETVVAKADVKGVSAKHPRPVPRPAIDLAGQAKPAVVRAGKDRPAAALARHGGPPPRQGDGFLWPVKGKILAKFGNLGGGKQSDGIIIAVPVGTPVKAAENGVVVYAGTDLKAYGKLLLVRHADGWMTAYANNDKLMVTHGEVVKRGQVIAHTGATGNVKGPQTYFEIRHEGRPVDPLPRLAES